MPDVKSDIKVSIVPYVTDVDLNSLRKQVEDVFSKPIKIKVDIADATKAVNTLFQQIQKQQEPNPKQAAIATRRAGISLSKNWNIDAERRRVKAVAEYNSELQAALQRANQAVQNVTGRPRNAVSDKEWRNVISMVNAYHKERRKAQEVYNSFSATNRYREAGRKALNLWDDKSAEQNIGKYGKYNAELERQVARTNRLVASLKSKGDIFTSTQEYVDLLAAMDRYQEELRKGVEKEKVERQSADYIAVYKKWDSAAEQSRVNVLSQYNSKLVPALQEVKDCIATMPDLDSAVDIDADTLSKLKQLDEYIQKYRAEVAKANNAKGALNAKHQVDVNFNNLAKQAENYYDKYAPNISKYKDLSNDWGNFLNSVKSPNNFTGGIVEARKQFSDLVRRSREAGTEVETLGHKFRKTFGDHLNMAVATFALNALRKSIQQVYRNIVELDKAIVDLQVSSGKTRAEVKTMMGEYSEFARSLGTTTVSIAQAADSWLRQGYSLSEVETLITDSTHLSVLGQIDSEEATKALTSTMKGYGIAVQDASTIVDKFTTVDMNAATSAGDLATAMAECAVSAKLMGIDINNLTGYLAVVLETTGDGAESVGVFMKTLIARMANIKAGKLVDPEDQSDISDVERVLTNYGIALRDQQGNFRNFQQVLDETAQKWREFGEAGKTSAQSAIAVAFGGTRNQEKFKVLMEGYQTAAEYADIAADSTGNAAEKYNAYMDGIEAHINQLTATFEKFSQTVLSSDVVKEGIDFLTDILNLLQQITAWSGNAGFGALTPLFGLGGGILGASGKGRLQQVGLAANMPLYALVATRNELAA